MKKLLFSVFLLCIILSGCNKDKNSTQGCYTQDPFEELPWLEDLKNSITNCTCEMSIIQAVYDDKTVFYLMMTDPLCNWYFTVTLVDCDGQFVKHYDYENLSDFENEVTPVKKIYTCNE